MATSNAAYNEEKQGIYSEKEIGFIVNYAELMASCHRIHYEKATSFSCVHCG